MRGRAAINVKGLAMFNYKIKYQNTIKFTKLNRISVNTYIP